MCVLDTIYNLVTKKIAVGNLRKIMENCENRNYPNLVQAFLKKWWVESDFKAPNLTLSLRLKVSSCHYNSIYITGIKLIVVTAVTTITTWWR
jgi:hypothetical protein